VRSVRSEEWGRGLRWAVLIVTLTGAALAAAFTATADEPDGPATAGPVAFRGSTSQHAGRSGSQRLPSNRLSFSLVRGAVRAFNIAWVAPCKDAAGGGATDAILGRTLVDSPLSVRHGRFSADADYSFAPGPNQTADVRLALTGRLAGRRAIGSLSINTEISVDTGPAVAFCQTVSAIRWTAVASRGAVDLTAPALLRPRPAEPGLIAYARAGPGGASAIWQADSNGTSPTMITRPRAGASDTSPTRDDPTLFAYARTAGGVSQVYVHRDFGSILTRFPGGRDTAFSAGAHDPAISPFGDRIAFSVGTGADCSLWVMGIAGTAQRRLTDHGGAPGCDDAPAWSPNGKSIAFERTATDTAGGPVGRTDLVVPASGGNPRALGFLAAPGAFSWSPGKQLVFISPPDNTGIASLQVVNANGSGRRTIRRAADLTGRPVWSPGRDAIALVLRRPDASTDIATISTTGNSAVDITNTPGRSESHPVWIYPLPLALTDGPSNIHVRPVKPRRHSHRRR
jgi:Tol biopolymer transport system component